MNHYPMTLYNLKGQPTRYFNVTSERVGDATPVPATPSPRHHIAVLDVSGSMYGDMAMVRSTLEKVFTAEEFNDPNLRVSLITYASNGDCRIHFQHVTVSEVLAPNSPYLSEIRGLHTRGMTGISQGLRVAETLVLDTEDTCISLHSDGYANDPSPYAEAQSIAKAVEALQKHPRVFVNTVAYRSYCDFPLLTAIANQLSGTCIQASSAREVYEALHRSQSVLSGPVTALKVEADADYVVYFSPEDKMCIGGTETLELRGVSPKPSSTVLRFTEITKDDAQTLQVLRYPPNPNAEAVFCRLQISLGNLSLAKQALVATRHRSLVESHARALVASEIAAWAADLDATLYSPPGMSHLTLDLNSLDTGTSVLQVLETFNLYPGGFRVNLPETLKGYKRRGLKRLAGTRNDDGTFVPAAYQLKPTEGDLVSVSGFDINRESATINMRVTRRAQLVRTSTREVVQQVAGIPLDFLTDYRNYTVVGDGVVTLPNLCVQFSDKRLFNALKAQGVVEGDMDFSTTYNIPLGQLSVVDISATLTAPTPEDVNLLLQLTVLRKILSGLIKGSSDSLTPEQILVLKAHHLTPALYFSAPTTNTYTVLSDAISSGHVDTRLSYSVKFGTPAISNFGHLYSGNAYLQRRFTFKDAAGADVAKPTLDMFWGNPNGWSLKTLSSRTKLDAVDDLTFPLYAGLLGLGDKTPLRQLLSLFGVSLDILTGPWSTEQAEILSTLPGKVDDEISRIYGATFTPLSFYVGASGTFPDSLLDRVTGGVVDAGKALTADQLVAKYPQVFMSKSEKEGMFYDLPTGVLVSIFTEAAYFTTEAGLAETASLVASED